MDVQMEELYSGQGEEGEEEGEGEEEEEGGGERRMAVIADKVSSTAFPVLNGRWMPATGKDVHSDVSRFCGITDAGIVACGRE